MSELPIEAVLPALKQHLNQTTRAVLVAAPGAGKTTRVPLALLDEPWLAGRKIVMLEPRRLATRAAARYMASALGEPVGRTVGYRVRSETRVGPQTRIEVMTEGVLTRLLQADPSLEEVGLVIFDEFHERHLQGDLGLTFCLESQSVLRDDLRLLVMSATLDTEPVAALLGDAPVIVSEGRSFPVDTIYCGRPESARLEEAIARTVKQALGSHEGDALVFLPGAAEIRRVRSRLEGLLRPEDRVRVAPLYGQLPQEAQDQAIAPVRTGERKVVLSTSIAESSLTVQGVRIVVDAGLMRVPRFSPRSGLSRLETVPVSRASADQRRGRAGRLAPGVCYRLWSERDERMLPAHSAPEIEEADLAPLALELAAWGSADPSGLSWLTPPPAAAYAQACELLRQLGALDVVGAITPHGRRMAALGMSPRLAHMVLCAEPLGLGGLACELAALLEERDVLSFDPSAPNADLRLRLDALRGGNAAASGWSASVRVDAAALERIRAEAARRQQALGVKPSGGGDEACGVLLAFAYPDRIAQNRGGKFLLSGGRGAGFAKAQPLSASPYLVVAELDDQGADGNIQGAAPITLEQLQQHLADRVAEERLVQWDAGAQAVRARKRTRLGALVLKESVLAEPDAEAVQGALLEGIAASGLAMLPWSKAAKQLRGRMAFLHRHETGWPDVSDAALLADLPAWLGPHVYGMRSRDDLQRLALVSVLEDMLSWSDRKAMDERMPTHMTVPSGSRIPVDYSDPEAPALAVRLQELFGLRESPRIVGGKVPLVLHLLSPAHRPVQVTKDLASFWANAYFEVKKDLKGRYPKHYWPDDPLAAVPTSRAKPRNS